jgi:hypothetical protein
MAAFMPEPHILDSVTAPALLGQAALEAGLPRRRLALAGHQAVAEQHFADGVGRDAGALDGGLDGGAAQVVRGQVVKSPWKPPMGVRAAPTMTMDSLRRHDCVSFRRSRM